MVKDRSEVRRVIELESSRGVEAEVKGIAILTGRRVQSREVVLTLSESTTWILREAPVE